MRFLLLALLCLLPNMAQAATSAVFSTPRDSVQLISQANAATDGTLTLGLKFSLKPGWHIYWSNPGDAGYAPTLKPQAPTTFGPLRFPAPSLLLQGPVAAYVLSGHVLLAFTAHQVGTSVQAEANWLVCSNICVPEHTHFSLTLTGGPSAEEVEFLPPQIVPSPFAAQISPNGTLSAIGPTATQVTGARFFPAAQNLLVNAAPQDLSFTADGLRLKLKLLQPGHTNLSGVLELTDRAGNMQALDLTATPGPNPTQPPYLLLALLGGLILNLMPCVFPILAMKALALARLGGAAAQKIRHEALGYSAGVLVTMLLLGGAMLSLRAFGSSVGWGFQFQSPIFVTLIAWLIFAATLNLAGLFELPMPAALGRIPAQRSFLTGVLAVLVAAPCTAPFMGGAVAAALIAPAPYALGIFGCLGLGLALPFLLLALAPRLAGFVPRPGAWMLWLQRALAIPMAATFLWLAWVLSHQTGPRGLTVLAGGTTILLLSLTMRRLRPLAFVCLLLLPLLHSEEGAPTLSLPHSEPYSAAQLADLRAAHQPVFVDLTAAWCVTCLVNEETTLATPATQADFATHHVRLLVGDWTNRNPEISALLAANNRDGVPLYLFYPANGGAPKILPQVLDTAIVRAAISG
jgi:DsbC/DsbD-like thiol-disulfide interchange protein/cytochrome c biogenesis protein CcdA